MEENTDLSLADKKILSILEYNPRATFKEIAKICHLSKDTIKYRINKLEENKIILGYTTFIDYKKLGNQSYKLFFKINASSEKKESLKEFLRKQKNVFALFESNGNWNLAIAIFAKNHQEFNSIENSILEKFGDIVSNRRFCSMIDVELYQKDFFGIHEKKLMNLFSLWGEVENNKLDDKDKKLIRIIHENARISLVDISDQLGLSLDAIKNRIIRLKENKIVTIYKTSINYKKLGFDHYKMLIFPKTFSNRTEEEIISFLRNISSCINIVRTIGPWKLEIEFLVKKTSEMDEMINQLNDKFKENILDIENSIIRNEELFACKDLLLE